MLPEIEKLLRVQHHDQKLKSLEKEVAGIPLEEEDIRDRLRSDQKALEMAKAALQEVEIAIKSLEIDVQTRRDTIARLKIQQFETRKNEEFQAMGKEIENYTAEITALEDREIELMERAEQQRKGYDAARTALAENEHSVAEEIEDLGTLKAKLEEDLEGEKAERTRLAEQVDETILYSYDRLFKAKHGVAVVGLVDEICQGCHMKVTRSTVVEVKSEKRVPYCENCGRILYWWTDDAVGKNRGEY